MPNIKIKDGNQIVTLRYTDGAETHGFCAARCLSSWQAIADDLVMATTVLPEEVLATVIGKLDRRLAVFLGDRVGGIIDKYVFAYIPAEPFKTKNGWYKAVLSRPYHNPNSENTVRHCTAYPCRKPREAA